MLLRLLLLSIPSVVGADVVILILACLRLLFSRARRVRLPFLHLSSCADCLRPCLCSQPSRLA